MDLDDERMVICSQMIVILCDRRKQLKTEDEIKECDDVLNYLARLADINI